MTQIVLGPNRAYPSLPTVSGTPENHTLVLEAIREAIEIHERRTKNIYDSFVRLGELRDLGLLNVDDSTGIVEDDDDDGTYIKRDGTSSAATGLILFGAGIDVSGNSVLSNVTIDGTLDVAGAITADSYGGILEADLVDKGATEGITGDWTFSGVTVVPEATVTAHEAAIDHDALTNFVSNEHIDWTADAGVDVHADNISEASVTQHEAALTIIEGQITGANFSNWDTAFGWGNHASVGYLTSETDPVFGASAAAGIDAGDISDWDTAYGWGNHASAGYAAASHNHAGVYEPVDASLVRSGTLSQEDNYTYLNRNNASNPVMHVAQVGAGPVAQFGKVPSLGSTGYTQSVTIGGDGSVAATGAVTGSNLNVANWDTAYGWGNHASAGYLTTISGGDHGALTGLSDDDHPQYAKLAGDTFTGTVSASSTVPRFRWIETDASADETRWQALAESGNWSLRAYLDNETSNTIAMQVVRTGTTIDEIELNATLLDFNGNVDISGSITAPSYNNSNWDTAYGWGNHASAGYLTTISGGDHGALTGLSDDDHPQYVLAASPAMTAAASISAAGSHLSLFETDAADPLDRTILEHNSGNFNLFWRDDSTATFYNWLRISDAGAVTWPSITAFTFPIDPVFAGTRMYLQGFTANGGTDFIIGAQPSAASKRLTFYDYQNTREGLTWDLDNKLWNFRTGSTIRVYDNGNTDYLSIAHDGTDINFTHSSTAAWNISGINQIEVRDGTDLWIRDGAFLRIYDSGDTDYAHFSHDGTDFNTTFNNTTQWDINGQFYIQAANGTTGITSAAQVDDHAGTARDVGFNVLPTGTADAAATLAAEHCGHTFIKTTTTARTLTIPASSNVDFPVGGVCTILNVGSSNNITVSDDVTATCYVLTGSAVTDIAGSATIAPGGVATLYRVTSDTYYLFGSGITP